MKHIYAITFLVLISMGALCGQTHTKHEAKLFVDSTGQVYTRADAPAYIFIAPADAEDQLMLVHSTDKAANPMQWDGAGKHYITHKDKERNMDIRFRILADGEPPKTTMEFQSGLLFKYNNIFFAESGSAATLTSFDDMSGVSQSFISIDDNSFAEFNQPITFSGNKEYEVQVYSIDNVGNTEDPKSYRVVTTTEAAVQMENIYFETNSTSLNAKSIAELNKLVEILKQFPSVHLEIGAHTDSKGNPNYNLGLSERRAQTVVNYLKSRSIPEGRLAAKGYGETMLINECAKGVECPDAKHRENRRVEFVITKVDEN